MENLRDDIVISFSQGDETAFDAIYYDFSPQLITFCRNLVPLEDAEDIAAETFFKLWRMRTRWDSFNNIRAFLYVTARNACFDLLKHRKRKAEKEKRILADLMAEEQKTILYSEIESELINQIMAEIENLPENCKAVFKMSYLEDYETAEIADKLHIASQTVFNLRSMALKAIKTAIFKRGLQLDTNMNIISLLTFFYLFGK